MIQKTILEKMVENGKKIMKNKENIDDEEGEIERKMEKKLMGKKNVEKYGDGKEKWGNFDENN